MSLLLLCSIIVAIGVQPSYQADVIGQMHASTLANNCSGGGYPYPTGRWLPDIERCRCHSCFTGPTCDTRVPEDECSVCLMRGQPYLLEQFWHDHFLEDPYDGLAVTPLDFRPSYEADIWGLFEEESLLMTYLEQELRKLHAIAGNVAIDDHIYVHSVGAREMFQAIYAVFAKQAQRPLQIFAQTPFYRSYVEAANRYTDVGNWNASYDINPNNVIELLTHPDNPTGNPRRYPYYPTNRVMYDLVYYWDHLCPYIDETLDLDLMVFSFTKFTGHAASRFGWAWVRDPQFAQDLKDHLQLSHNHLPIDTQFRAYNIIKALNANDGELYHRFIEYVKEQMRIRWLRVKQLFDPLPENDYFIDSTQDTAYLFIRCRSNQTPEECFDAFVGVGLAGTPGAACGVANYVRINLTVFQSDFELVLEKFRMLISGKKIQNIDTSLCHQLLFNPGRHSTEADEAKCYRDIKMQLKKN